MYDDNPGWKLFFNFINCLYREHPVKKEIAGTVESISHITADYLYKCYNTFYNLSNMSLVIAGNVDIQSASKVIEEGIKKNEPFTEPIKKIYPMFMMGFKDNDVNISGRELLKKDIEMRILMRMLFAKGSDIYKKLYESNLINSTFSLDYTVQPDYGFTSLDGESKNPKEVYETILDELEKLNKTGLSYEKYERAKKVVWGRYIRMYNDIEDLSTTFMQYLFMGVDYFDYYDVYKSVTFEDVENRFKEHFKREYSALSVINPL